LDNVEDRAAIDDLRNGISYTDDRTLGPLEMIVSALVEVARTATSTDDRMELE
jgi:hypothetical protein